jgi:signal transduction histidine kinase
VQGAEGELQQVVTNHLLNALDATATGGDRVGVALELAPADAARRVRIVVEDDGAGIRHEHLPKIFEPFFTTKSGQGGTGLGLAISRQIVEQHGGTISAENNADRASGARGCRFVVELPAAAPRPAGRPS